MALNAGTNLGPYTVTAQIGAGGMGEVWRARDTRLDRDVALKVLPEAFTSDPDRLARFEREAKVLASLNHPNIGHIYGLEEAEGTKALVLELVEGPTLADRIADGPIPVDEALPIAKQIAEALEAAHEQGIIHRDLKPANVKVKADGTVKVLDFGLAKAFQPEASGASASESPTISLTAAATQMGMVIGTAAYMSPEQARGKAVDKRTDIWAFGVVLYEMLTGARPFQGEDVSLTLASVMKSDVDVKTLPRDLPTSVRSTLNRCLEKDVSRRIRDIGDVTLAMEGAFETTPGGVSDDAVAPDLRFWQRPATGLGLLAGAALMAGLAVWSLTRPVPPQLVRVPILLEPGQVFSYTGRHTVAISPDGSNIAFTANGALWLRPVDQLDATIVPGTETEARSPFFSPDGQWVGFFADDQLQKASITGGAPVTLCGAENPWGVSWGVNDAILFGQGPEGIWRVPGAGGTPEQIIAVDDNAEAHGPQLLPTGSGREWVLFTLLPSSFRNWNAAQIVAQSLDTGERRLLIDGGRDGHYVPTGHLVYSLDGGLLAVPFDDDTLEVTGGPVPLVDAVDDAGAATGAAHFAVAPNGSLVYVPGAGVGLELVWVDLEGRVEPIGADAHPYTHPRVSPDGGRVAVARTDGDEDVWIYELGRGTLERLTFTDGEDSSPAWTPDGTRLAMFSTHDGDPGIFWQRADGTGQPERLSTGRHRPNSWSPDGRHLTFVDVGASIDIGVVELDDADDAATVSILLDSDAIEGNNSVSPDGRWLAFNSDITGAEEVYVRPFPDVESGRTRISLDGGFAPVWQSDGGALFYRDQQAIMRIAVTDGPPSTWGAPEQLFEGSFAYPDPNRQFDVAPDGEHFLMLRSVGSTEVEGSMGAHLILVLNWFEELKERVPVP